MRTYRRRDGEVRPPLLHRKDVRAVINSLKNDPNKTETVKKIFQEAIENKNTQLIGALVLNGVEIEPINESNQTAIHLAAENHFLSIIDFLFRHDCTNVVNHTDANNFSHFHVACITGDARVVERFIKYGVDVNHRFRSQTHDERNDFTGLHFAVKNAQVNIVQLLLKHRANVNATDFIGRTPLHLACGISEAVGDAILSKKVNIFPKTENNNKKAIDIHEKTREIVKLLLTHKSNVNKPDRDGYTPLCHVFRDDTLNFTEKRFLRDSLDFRINHEEFRRIKLAIIGQLREKQSQKLELLLQHGADVSIRTNEIEDTILHLAIRDLKVSRGLRQLGEPCFDDKVHKNMVKAILKQGIDVNAMNRNGETPLSIAVSLLSADVVGVLVNHDADIRGIKFDSIYYPTVLPCLEAVENLLEIVATRERKGFHLSQSEHLEILKFLICNNKGCSYADPEDENAAYKMRNLLELGTDGNVISTLEQLSRGGRYSRGILNDQVNIYLMKLHNSGLRVSREVDECLKRFGITGDFSELPHRHLNEYAIEANRMREFTLNNGKSLAEILTAPLDETYSFLKNSDYMQIFCSSNFRKFFPHNTGLIKGCFAICLVRRFVLRAANDCVRSLTQKPLPDPCCERISKYLSNEELLNVCLAGTIEISRKELCVWSSINRLLGLQMS